MLFASSKFFVFKKLEIPLVWEGEGINEKGINPDSRSILIEIDPYYFRPTEVGLLIGDPSKAHEKLAWKPEYDLQALIKDMMMSDIKLFKRDDFLKKGGFTTLNYFE